MEIKGFLETSLIDWDGHIASVIFLPGCNFRCPYCYNHILARHPDRLETVAWERIESYLKAKRDWIDGVVVTGGEATIHQDLPELLNRIHGLGLQAKLDTNGYQPQVLERLFSEKLVDYVAMDYKAALDARYYAASGTELELDRIGQSLRLVMDSGIPYEFRTTVVPGFHLPADIADMGPAIRGAGKWALQQFVPREAEGRDLRQARPLGAEVIQEMRAEGARWAGQCLVRGRA